MGSLASHPAPSHTLQGTDLGDEYLFYDRQQDRVHVLNGTAREIYLLCDGTRSAEEVADVLAQRYAIDVHRALDDTTETIQRLCDLGLLVS